MIGRSCLIYIAVRLECEVQWVGSLGVAVVAVSWLLQIGSYAQADRKTKGNEPAHPIAKFKTT